MCAEIARAQAELNQAVVECRAAEEEAQSKQIQRWKKSSKLKDLPISDLVTAMLEATEDGTNAAEDCVISTFVDMFLEDTLACRDNVRAKQSSLDALIKKAAVEKISIIKQSIPDYETVTDSATSVQMLQQCMKLMESVLLGQQRTDERIAMLERRLNHNITSPDLSAEQAKAAGYSCLKLKLHGYTAAEVIAAGYTTDEVRSAGYTATEVRSAGYTGTEIYAAGYTLAELGSAGYRLNEARSAGYTGAEVRSAGYTCNEVRSAGYTGAEVRSAGFTESEISAAGYHWNGSNWD